MSKFQTTADVLLFKQAKPGVDAHKLLPEGTVFESDGVTVTSQSEAGTFHYLRATVDGKTGYILQYHTTAAE